MWNKSAHDILSTAKFAFQLIVDKISLKDQLNEAQNLPLLCFEDDRRGFRLLLYFSLMKGILMILPNWEYLTWIEGLVKCTTVDISA